MTIMNLFLQIQLTKNGKKLVLKYLSFQELHSNLLKCQVSKINILIKYCTFYTFLRPALGLFLELLFTAISFQIANSHRNQYKTYFP